MTMTLETMLAWCNEFLETAPDARNVESMRDGIRAAILDRDADRFTASNQTLRAERAEAELAALRKRIAAARMGTANRPVSYWGEEASFGIVTALVDAKLIGSPVRLLVGDDDEH